MEAYSTTGMTREGHLRKSDPHRCTVCGGANRKPPKPGTCTYFAHRQGYMKIGVTGNVQQRMRGLSAGRLPNIGVPEGMDWKVPVTLWLVLPGDLEHQMHEALATAHVVYEWFDAAAVHQMLTTGRHLVTA